MLRVQDLNVHHGLVHALRGVSLELHCAELVAVIGANGAGKSTLLGAMAGVYQGTGNILLKGTLINKMKAETVVRKGISLVPERRQVFEALSVYDNLLLGAYHRFRKSPGEVKKDINQVIELFPALGNKTNQLAGTLSGGMQQMLAIGRGLMARPEVLLLDEPSLGVAPLMVKEIFTTLTRLKNEGTAILLVEQNARAALKVADRVYVMEQGCIVTEATPEILISDQRIKNAYLGKNRQLHVKQKKPASYLPEEFGMQLV